MLSSIRRVVRGGALAVAVPAVVAALAAPAGVCGGLVGANGTIQLTRTTTLAAYHDGVERYVTSFEFSGQGKSVGSIVPLPGIPSKVERGGSWTLQRLEREVAPPIDDSARFAVASNAAAGKAQVILQTQIDALDITVLKGGGSEVGKWAVDNGFLLTPDAPAMLDFYARRSPIFMAARFDVSRAQQLRQVSGDGTPIMLTIPTPEPWVPLHILSLGLDKAAVVDADVFLLTDTQPKLLAGGSVGITLPRSEPANAQLLSDLRSDKHMGWVPQQMWFTYLRLDVPAGQLGYDLAISTHAGAVPRLADTGVDKAAARPIVPEHAGRGLWPLFAALGVGAVMFAGLGLLGRRRPRRPLGAAA